MQGGGGGGGGTFSTGGAARGYQGASKGQGKGKSFQDIMAVAPPPAPMALQRTPGVFSGGDRSGVGGPALGMGPLTVPNIASSTLTMPSGSDLAKAYERLFGSPSHDRGLYEQPYQTYRSGERGY